MLFLAEMTCFVPRVAQCLRFVSCHRLGRCYRPIVCPSDRGLCCLQLPRVVACHPPQSWCSVTVSFLMSRLVTPSLFLVAIWGLCVSHICLVLFRLRIMRSMKTSSVLQEVHVSSSIITPKGQMCAIPRIHCFLVLVLVISRHGEQSTGRLVGQRVILDYFIRDSRIGTSPDPHRVVAPIRC